MGRRPFMPASTLTPQSAAPTRARPQKAQGKKAAAGFTRPLGVQSFQTPLFLANVSRPKREGVGDPQFNLLSAGAGKGPRAAQDEFYKPKGWERAVPSLGRATFGPKDRVVHAPFPKGMNWGGKVALTRRLLRHRQQVHLQAKLLGAGPLGGQAPQVDGQAARRRCR